MAQDGITATVIGRWGVEPTVVMVNSGREVAKGRWAVGSRVKVEGKWVNGPTLWLDVQRWDGTLPGTKGDQVELTGTLRHGEYTDRQGNTKQTLTLVAESAQVLWSKATATVANDTEEDDLGF
jgi:single-stranded DNA-binding protein